MGTPNVDVDLLAHDLAKILKNSAYRSFYAELLEQDRIDQWHRAEHKERIAAKSFGVKVELKPRTVDEFALATANRAFGGKDDPSLLYPVTVEELAAETDSIALYRVFDGNLARTLGNWWSNPELLQDIAASSPCRDGNGQLKHDQVTQFMLSAGFVHPHWNTGKDVARMLIPAGVRVPVITGKGNWRAMRAATAHDQSDPLKISKARDLKKLGMVPMAGPTQIFVPLFRDLWVKKVPHESGNWPFS